MKVLSIVLSVIAALLIALIAAFFIGAALDADVSVATLPAAQDALGFAAAVESVQLESAPAIYETLESVAAADYALTDITVTFHNKGFFAAEWLTFEFIPATGDVALCTQSADRLDLPARSEAQLTFSLLSKEGASGAGRALNVEYYVLGMRCTMTVPLELS